jgi:hypothetical protein
MSKHSATPPTPAMEF